MKINKDDIGVQYTGNSGFCLITGIDTSVQGDIEVDLEGCNSYVITSLDYLVNHTELLLSLAKERIEKRLRSEQTASEEI